MWRVKLAIRRFEAWRVGVDWAAGFQMLGWAIGGGVVGSIGGLFEALLVHGSKEPPRPVSMGIAALTGSLTVLWVRYGWWGKVVAWANQPITALGVLKQEQQALTSPPQLGPTPGYYQQQKTQLQAHLQALLQGGIMGAGGAGGAGQSGGWSYSNLTQVPQQQPAKPPKKKP